MYFLINMKFYIFLNLTHLLQDCEYMVYIDLHLCTADY